MLYKNDGNLSKLFSALVQAKAKPFLRATLYPLLNKWLNQDQHYEVQAF